MKAVLKKLIAGLALSLGVIALLFSGVLSFRNTRSINVLEVHNRSLELSAQAVDGTALSTDYRFR